MPRTQLILDGLHDAQLGRELSRRWLVAGVVNIVDPSGQGAEVERADGRPVDEPTRAMLGRIARELGVEVVLAGADGAAGETSPAALRERVLERYRRRLLWTVGLGLPVVGLHYLRLGWLACGQASIWEPNLMLGLEAVLTLVLLVAAGGMVIRRGATAARGGRWTMDGYLTVVLSGTWALSLVAALHVWWSDGGAQPTAWRTDVWFHAVPVILLTTLWQRRQAQRWAERLSGRAGLMVPGLSWLLAGGLALSVAAGLALGWGLGVGLGMLCPGAGGLVGVNPRQPRWLALLPAGALAGMLILGPYAFQRSIAGVEIEIVGLLALVLTWMYVAGWRGWPKA